jgi:lysophospholipase L1-like esterase
MIQLRFARLAAASIAAIALAACSGSNSGKMLINPLVPAAKPVPQAPAQVISIAGVGDSLTAGVQSGGLLGLNLPIIGVSPVLGQIGPVQETQEHGFFSLLWQQANGVGLSTMENPDESPLPLIGANAVGDLLAPTTSGFPYSVTTTCDSHQIASNSFSTALTLRQNAALNPWDVGIPGQTVHEALYMNGAIGTCSEVPAAFVPLNSLVNGESQNFWPVLAGFGAGTTQVAAAVSMHAKLATVWLGSNDLLKIALSNGAAPVTSPASMQADTTQIIKNLQGAGSKVAVSNLVDVMGAATFIPQPLYQVTLQNFIANALILANPGLTLTQALALALAPSQYYANAEIAQTGVGANGYFTINAVFETLEAASATPPGPPPVLVTGDYVSDAVALEVKSLNTSYNTSIAAAASATGAALVDVHTVFVGIETAGGLPINPPYCCTLGYGGGFFSLDGIHPSNTGYAVLANVFIDQINKSYGMTIPEVNVNTVYSTDPYAPGNGVGPASKTRKAANTR